MLYPVVGTGTSCCLVYRVDQYILLAEVIVIDTVLSAVNDSFPRTSWAPGTNNDIKAT